MTPPTIAIIGVSVAGAISIITYIAHVSRARRAAQPPAEYHVGELQYAGTRDVAGRVTFDAPARMVK